jgi:hypothetical protein
MFKSIRNVIIPALFLTLLSACTFLFGEGQELLFAYNLGDGDGLHLAHSEDGYKWTPLKNGEPFLKSEIGSKLLREPSLIEPQRGEFHLIWLSGEEGFGYASSKDLIKWSDQRLIPISDKLKTYNTRSPILYYERKPRLFHIIWSATVPGLREEKVEEGQASNILLSITTRDFANFSEPQVFYDPKYNCPDASLVMVGENYKLVFKDGRPEQGTLRTSSAPTVNGKWSEPTDPIASVTGVERPSAVKFGDDWLIYFYQPQNNLSYGALRSRDFVQWEDVSSQISVPQGMRHGSVMRIPDLELEVLQKEK